MDPQLYSQLITPFNSILSSSCVFLLVTVRDGFRTNMTQTFVFVLHQPLRCNMLKHLQEFATCLGFIMIDRAISLFNCAWLISNLCQQQKYGFCN